MDARERSFLAEAQRQVDSGRSLDEPVDLYFEGGGVRIEARADGATRMQYAARWGWCAAITWLLEQGADIHVGCPGLGRTPLHKAALYGHLDAAVLLLDAGARVDDRNDCGSTALHSARHTDICQLLLSRGASLDARNDYGEDPEAFARRNGRTATADLLAAVRAAGGWRPYCTAQRPYCDAQFRELRRELRAPGAVAESSERLYERVFVELPNAVFPRVLAFRPDF
jgi:ankyrin